MATNTTTSRTYTVISISGESLTRGCFTARETSCSRTPLLLHRYCRLHEAGACRTPQMAVPGSGSVRTVAMDAMNESKSSPFVLEVQGRLPNGDRSRGQSDEDTEQGCPGRATIPRPPETPAEHHRSVRKRRERTGSIRSACSNAQSAQILRSSSGTGSTAFSFSFRTDAT